MANWKVIMPLEAGTKQLCLEKAGDQIKLCLMDAADQELAALNLNANELDALGTMVAQARANKQLADM